MKDFSNYLVSKQFTSKKESHFFQMWVKSLYQFIGKNTGKSVLNGEIDRYINYISKSKNEWQVRQAQEAIRLYLYYLNQPQLPSAHTDSNIKTQWQTVASEMVNMLRLKQLSLQTERTYMQWLRRFYRFWHELDPGWPPLRLLVIWNEFVKGALVDIF